MEEEEAEVEAIRFPGRVYANVEIQTLKDGLPLSSVYRFSYTSHC